MSHAEFFGKTSNNPGDSASLQPTFGDLWHLAFPKTKIIFEREDISDHWWDSGKSDGAADGNWELWGPKVPTLKETEVSLSYVQCFLYLVSSSISASIFHSTCQYLWTGLICVPILAPKHCLHKHAELMGSISPAISHMWDKWKSPSSLSCKLVSHSFFCTSVWLWNPCLPARVFSKLCTP